MFNGRAEVGRALELLREGLGPFVEQQMVRAPAARLADFMKSNGWLEGKRIRDWDVAVLLKLMQYMWNDVFQHVLGRVERAHVTELQDWRNKWAHQEKLSTDDIDRALDTAFRLLHAIKAESQAAAVAELRNRLVESRQTPNPRPNPHMQSSPQPSPRHGSQADAIRQYALVTYVVPWRESGVDGMLAIRAGDIGREMGLRNATPNVCSALESGKFLALANVELVRRDGPRRSTTTTYHYRCTR